MYHIQHLDVDVKLRGGLLCLLNQLCTNLLFKILYMVITYRQFMQQIVSLLAKRIQDDPKHLM